MADPFGGIGGGGIMAGYSGLNWIGVELEDRFHKLCNANLAMHRPKWLALGEANSIKLIQGDSRRFAELVGQAVGVVTSPPYADSVNQERSGIDWDKANRPDRSGGPPKSSHSQGVTPFTYGAAEGQIGALKSGDLSAVVTSPPFGDARSDTTKSQPTKHGGDCADRHHTTQAGAGYGDSQGQIDALPTGDCAAVVTSPPWEKSLNDGYDKAQPADRYAAWAKNLDGSNRLARSVGQDYGASDGQIGKERGETYWQAMDAVYRQCLIAIRPGGVLCVVVKDYVKDKARVPLCDQTLQLLTHIGFEPVERIHAMLVRETRHGNLFGGETVKRTERKSFFRRLAESKGSPRIDHEEVLVVRKPDPSYAASGERGNT